MQSKTWSYLKLGRIVMDLNEEIPHDQECHKRHHIYLNVWNLNIGKELPGKKEGGTKNMHSLWQTTIG